jgi:L-threonylcarbamoyladenylate synthase
MHLISQSTTAAIKAAAAALINGNLVAFPTETVYGLGADAANEVAVKKIYKVKGRPVDHPLIVHISNLEHLDKWASEIPEFAIVLARAYWPGPMTLILPRTQLAKNFITGGQESVGIRIPDQEVALSLLVEFEKQGGAGIAAPSANRFGKVSPTTARAVQEELNGYLNPKDFILNDGSCTVGIESTIIDCTTNTPLILRPGAVTRDMILKITKIEPGDHNLSNLKAPGMLKSHYSPKAKVILNQKPNKGDGFIALMHIETPPGVIRIASPVDSNEFAQVLYESLRNADRQKIMNIHIQLPLGDDIAAAIKDRLIKAAHDSNQST